MSLPAVQLELNAPAEAPVAPIKAVNGGALVRVLEGGRWPGRCEEYAVPTAAPVCPFCGQPVEVPAMSHTSAGAVLVTTSDGRLFLWCHQKCRATANGRESPTQGLRTRRDHPPCARCSAPWDDHERLGYRDPNGAMTRSCPDGDGSQLYEHEPGKVGVRPVEWLRQEVS